MKPRNFPSRKALRQKGVHRSSWPPEVTDIKVRIGAKGRREGAGAKCNHEKLSAKLQGRQPGQKPIRTPAATQKQRMKKAEVQR